jgi:hypothetical protein
MGVKRSVAEGEAALTNKTWTHFDVRFQGLKAKRLDSASAAGDPGGQAMRHASIDPSERHHHKRDAVG